MKNTFALFLMLCFFIPADAQFPTRGEIFDFDIGDEFHFQFSDQYEYTYIVTRYFILDKNEFANQDSVTYLVRREKYTSVSPPMTEIMNSYKIDTFQRRYGRLSDIIDPFSCPEEAPEDACVITSSIDTMGYCDLDSYEFNIMEGIPNFEYDRVTLRYAKGLGEYYERITSDSENPSFPPTEMFYFKKGDMDCGTPNYILINTYSAEFDQSILLSPNPTSGLFQLNFDRVNPLKIQIINQQGQLISEQEVFEEQYQGDISSHIPGIYFIKINDGQRIAVKKLLKY